MIQSGCSCPRDISINIPAENFEKALLTGDAAERERLMNIIIIAVMNWAWNYLSYDRGIRLIIPFFQKKENGEGDGRADDNCQ